MTPAASARLRVLARAVAFAWLTGCQPPAPTQAPTAAVGEVRSAQRAERPPLQLVERPGPGAVAIAWLAPSAAAAAWLAEEARRELPPSLRVHAHGLGLELTLPAADAEGAKSAWNSLSQFFHKSRQFQGKPRSNAATGSAADLCDGSIGAAVDVPPERWSSALGFRAIAAAVVGSAAVLSAVESAWESDERWPEGAPTTAPWPAAPIADVGPGPAFAAVGLYIPGAGGAAEEMVFELSDPTTPLAARFRAAAGASPDRLVATRRAGGTCIRIDLPSGTPSSVAQSSWVLRDWLRRSPVAPEDGVWRAHRTVLDLEHPAEAAAATAWRAAAALGDPESELPLSAVGVLRYPQLERAEADRFRQDLAEQLGAVPPPRALPWMQEPPTQPGTTTILLASPCGARLDHPGQAGATALLLSALIPSAGRLDGVEVRPWVTTDGAGLLAIGRPARRTERPTETAIRTASALGRVAAALPLDPQALMEWQRVLTRRQADATTGAYWEFLRSLTSGQQSALVAGGVPQELDDLTVGAVEAQRARWLASPLRVVALTPPETEPALRSELQSWLPLPASGAVACPNAPPPTSGSLALSLAPEVTEWNGWVGVVLPSAEAPAARTAHQLLAGDHGWLRRSLVEAGLATEAHAWLLGGATQGALAIALRAPPEKLEAAVLQTRHLLEQLGEAAVDGNGGGLVPLPSPPRQSGTVARRLEALWSGPASTESLDLAAFQRWVATYLTSSRQLSLELKAGPPDPPASRPPSAPPPPRRTRRGR